MVCKERDCDVQKREGKNQARKEESEEHISSDVVGLVIETSTIFFSICEIDFKTVLFEPQMITEWIFGWCENGVSSHIMIGI